MIDYNRINKQPLCQARKNKPKWLKNLTGAILVLTFLIAMMSLEDWILYEMGA